MTDLDPTWLLVALPVAFALGWLASRLDLRQLRRDRREAPRAYFKGLNLLLNEQQDKAIDAFVEAVQNDPDSADLHFALGNLFRRRGDFERAIRVHEHLLQRADMKLADRQRAGRALALDHMKAGLFDRAEQGWLQLLGTPFDREARLSLLALYERSRDWMRAAEMAGQLDQSGEAAFGPRVAHHWCELAQEADARGDVQAAETALGNALAVAPDAARPRVLAGERLARAGRHEEALAAWDEVRVRQPSAFMLVANAYADSALACGRADAARSALREQCQRTPGMDLVRALARLEAPGSDDATRRLAAHLREHQPLSAAAEMLAIEQARWPEGAQQDLQKAVARAAAPLQRYRCAACGFEAQRYFWQCPGCLSWDSYPTLRIEEL